MTGNDSCGIMQAAGSGLKVRNFRLVAERGFGDAYNCYPHSMAWFQDHLYVGTTRANLHLLNVGNKALPGLVGDLVWPVKVPDNFWDLDLRAQIWRYNPGTAEWKKIFTSPTVRGRDGFEVPLSVGFRSMAQFQGASDPVPALYVNTWATSQMPETVLLRSLNGVDFDIVSKRGFGLEGTMRVLRALIPFNGRLFTAPAMGAERGKPNSCGQAVVLSSSDPDQGQWQIACKPNFGDPNNISVFQMAECHGHLYAGTMNVNDGYQIWKTDAKGEPPFTWTKVITNGAYRGRLNQMAMSMKAFGNHLYVGSAIQTGGYDRINNVGPAGSELIRIGPDGSWDLIVGEPRLTSEGLKIPLSGRGPGFDKIFSGYFWQMCVHDGWLYLGTAVWSTFLTFSNSAIMSKRVKQLDPKSHERYMGLVQGFDLWRTDDGIRWSPVTRNGFDNKYNIGVRNMVSTSLGLFVGVANSFGPEVAVKRTGGWRYEPNPKSGLEIWLGTSGPRTSEATVDARENVSCLQASETTMDIQVEKLISDYYGASGFRHVGFWGRDIKDPQGACANLMEEILSFITQKKGSILDIGCGKGATTRHLLKYFSADDITGVTDRSSIADCRKSAPGVAFFSMKPSNLLSKKASFDHAICVEGADIFQSREQMIQTIYRLLRTDGTFVFTDMLPEKNAKKTGLFRTKSGPASVSGYRDLLLASGFHDVRVEDVTDQCWKSFLRNLHRYLLMKKLSGEADEQISNEVINALPGNGAPIGRYLLLAASKK